MYDDAKAIVAAAADCAELLPICTFRPAIVNQPACGSGTFWSRPRGRPDFACRTASRAYLRHLHLAGEITAATLLTIHNLAFYLDTLRRIGQSIRLGRFNDFRTEMLRQLAAAPEDEAPGPHTP